VGCIHFLARIAPCLLLVAAGPIGHKGKMLRLLSMACLFTKISANEAYSPKLNAPIWGKRLDTT